MAWLERNAGTVYRGIQRADRDSRIRFGGHGSALAQAYGHPILPLCDRRDRETAIAWGLDDFRRRFGRHAEGMWLPETAVDNATLAALAAAGMRFCILAPRQAATVRLTTNDTPGAVNESTLDTRRPYRVLLPGNTEIAVFFYDGALAQQIAFAGLLRDGAALGRTMLNAFRPDDEPQLVHVATDGESYGHHHTFGEMALARALTVIEESEVSLTNYGQFLELYPPTAIATIIENSSWSCPHELGRWSRDCGCASEYRADYHQRWRQPLRNLLSVLQDDLQRLFADRAGRLIDDPWKLRNAYHHLRLSSDPDTIAAGLDRLAGQRLVRNDREQLLRLLEMQRFALLTHTSCAWFFEDINRIEPVQILRYADRALAYAREWDDGRAATRFHDQLQTIPGNPSTLHNGSLLFQQEVISARRSPEQVALWTSLRQSLDPRNHLLPWSDEFESEVHTTTRIARDGLMRVAGTVQVRGRRDRIETSSAFCWIEDGPEGLFGGLLLRDGIDPFPTLAPRLTTLDGNSLSRILKPLLDPLVTSAKDLGPDECDVYRKRRVAAST